LKIKVSDFCFENRNIVIGSLGRGSKLGLSCKFIMELSSQENNQESGGFDDTL